MSMTSACSSEELSQERAAKIVFLKHQHRLIRKCHQTFSSQTLFISKKYQNRPSTPSSSSFPSSCSQVRTLLTPSHQVTVQQRVYRKVLSAFFHHLTSLPAFKGGTNWKYTVKTKEMIQINIHSREHKLGNTAGMKNLLHIQN